MKRKNKRIEIDGQAAERICDHPDCIELGEYRAPKSPSRLSDFYWFCLEHVRDYNLEWNYYKDMQEPEIEAEIRNDTVWRRPTWPMGSSIGAGRNRSQRLKFDDSFGVFREDRYEAKTSAEGTTYDAESHHSFEVMEIRPPTTLTQLKSRYKELVKKLHPDVNGGDPAAEERLKDINQAYAKLKKVVLS
tara:strand:- start:81 stop:647 length:567 start_codon:yes stop_codon:yes gene_type:complete